MEVLPVVEVGTSKYRGYKRLRRPRTDKVDQTVSAGTLCVVQYSTMALVDKSHADTATSRTRHKRFDSIGVFLLLTSTYISLSTTKSRPMM